MKYLVVLPDGMADYGVPELEGKTPLQVSHKPNMDWLAQHSEVGLVKTVPEGLPPGSDVANLSVMGYDPQIYYTGRSPLEAASIGVDLQPTDVAFRCNLVTLSNEEHYDDKTMLDYSSDEITTLEARELIVSISQNLGNNEFIFYPGVSYRHLLVWRNGLTNCKLTPPHDISDKKIFEYLPQGDGSEKLLDLMQRSIAILKEHPINQKRLERGLRPATSIWLWGQGKKPSISSFKDKYGLNGSVISAVDLAKGLGICAGLKIIDVPGATGNVNTNFKGKAEAALQAFKDGDDFVYLHMEAPDEAGHRGEIDNKIKSIELIDDQVISYLLMEIPKLTKEFRILLLPDHPTPLTLRTHVSDPVPYIIYDSTVELQPNTKSYDENSAKDTSMYVNEGYRLMDRFILSKNMKSQI